MINLFVPSPGPDDRYVFLPSVFPGSPIRSVLSLKAAGDMTYVPGSEGASRAELFGMLDISPDRVRSLRQTHSHLVHRVGADSGPTPDEGDGMVTGDPNAVLAITVADCLPVFLFSRDGTRFGLVHSGWKGTGIAARAVELLEKDYGVRRSYLTAVLGPCIGPCCYDVPEDRASFFSDRFGSSCIRRNDGRTFLDLREANRNLLEAAGVRSVTIVDACTACNPVFGSFRREGPEKFTRMAALIGIF